MNDRDKLIGLIADIQNDFEKWCVECAEDGHKDHQPLGEYLADKLLANGVIVPPCKVGDYVWLVFTPKYPANPNDYGKWFMTQDGVQRIIFGAKGLSIETWNMGTISAKELGKKIFLTKEEAERALVTDKNVGSKKEREQNG